MLSLCTILSLLRNRIAVLRCRAFCLVSLFVHGLEPCEDILPSHGRNRINVLGAVNAVTKDVTTLINTTYVTTDTIIEFMIQLKEKYARKPIVLVLDKARYQHCNALKEKAKQLKITLLFLPPYSPNLNIIERF